MRRSGVRSPSAPPVPGISNAWYATHQDCYTELLHGGVLSLIANVVRRGRIYYFRSRVPRDLIRRTCRRESSRSLGTSDPSVARRRAAVVATAIPHLSLRNAVNQEQIDA